MRYVTGILGVILFLIVAIFSIQNRDSVDVSFLVWSMRLPKVFMILGIYVLGMLSRRGLMVVIKQALK